MSRALHRHRLLAALAICLSGWALTPFVSFSREIFGWQGLSGVYKIFGDGVERGNTTAWSQTFPPPPLRLPVTKPSDQLVRRFRVDFGLLHPPPGEQTLEILAGLDPDGRTLFGLEGRAGGSGWELRAHARRNDGGREQSEWRRVEVGVSVLEIEWWQAHELTADGRLLISLNDRLVLWLVDLDNNRLELAELSLLQIGGDPAVEPLAD